jgi:hypothetical protein
LTRLFGNWDQPLSQSVASGIRLDKSGEIIKGLTLPCSLSKSHSRDGGAMW